MKIAMVAPPYIPCPPNGYGGVERVVATLVDGLADAGHDVTLFAHPGSRVKARLVTPPVEQTDIFDFQKDALHAASIVRDLSDFEIVHNHSVALLLFRQWLTRPMLTTVHGTTNYDAVRPIYRVNVDAKYASISDNQRHSGLEGMNWLATVYNGIDTDFYRPAPRSELGYLLHLGTLCHRKGTAEAVQVALKSNRRLVLAGRIDPINQRYYDEHVQPFIDGDQIRYIGEVDGEEKVALYQQAEAVVLPINWHEPFGLVMAEAGACGIPVLVHDMGSAREVVEHNVTGFISTDERSMVAYVDRLNEIDPSVCRSRVQERFGLDAMVRGYLSLYATLTANA